MPLRRCAACGNDLPAGATARAKFCSATCRKRANRSGDATPDLKLVTIPPETDSADPPTTRLEALESAARRLVRLLDESDPRSAAALNKEYRDTLREIESVRKASEEGGHGRTTGSNRQPFSASAV